MIFISGIIDIIIHKNTLYTNKICDLFFPKLSQFFCPTTLIPLFFGELTTPPPIPSSCAYEEGLEKSKIICQKCIL